MNRPETHAPKRPKTSTDLINDREDDEFNKRLNDLAESRTPIGRKKKPKSIWIRRDYDKINLSTLNKKKWSQYHYCTLEQKTQIYNIEGYEEVESLLFEKIAREDYKIDEDEWMGLLSNIQCLTFDKTSIETKSNVTYLMHYHKIHDGLYYLCTCFAEETFLAYYYIPSK